MKRLLNRLLCFLTWHRGHIEGDETHVWLQCDHCGKRCDPELYHKIGW